MKKNPQKIQKIPLAVTWFWTQYAHILPESNQIYQNSPEFSISLLSARSQLNTSPEIVQFYCDLCLNSLLLLPNNANDNNVVYARPEQSKKIPEN